MVLKPIERKREREREGRGEEKKKKGGKRRKGRGERKGEEKETISICVKYWGRSKCRGAKIVFPLPI